MGRGSFKPDSGNSDQSVRHMGEPVEEALPSGTPRRCAKRITRLEDRCVLKVGGQIVDRLLLVRLSDCNDEQRKVDARLHAFLLWVPGRAENGIWFPINIIDTGRLHLSQIAAEVADQIGAAKVRWEPLERPSALASRAIAGGSDELLAHLAQILLFGRHPNLPLFQR